MRRQVARSRPPAVRRILKEGRGNLNLLRGRKLEPFEALCTDFTEVRYVQGTRKAQLMAMVDPASGWVGAWAVGESANRQLALRCWDKAKDNLTRLGKSVRGLVVHHDQDTVYVSYRWLRQLLIEDEVVVSYCERDAKGNPWMESFWSRFKGENGSLFWDATTLQELEELVSKQMHYHNHQRRHSRIGYLSPMEYLAAEGLIASGYS